MHTEKALALRFSYTQMKTALLGGYCGTIKKAEEDR